MTADELDLYLCLFFPVIVTASDDALKQLSIRDDISVLFGADIKAINMVDGQANYMDDLIIEYMKENSTAQCKKIYSIMKDNNTDFKGALKRLVNHSTSANIEIEKLILDKNFSDLFSETLSFLIPEQLEKTDDVARSDSPPLLEKTFESEKER